jgi:hypothetical protein
MSRARRIKPSTVEGRKRQAELGKIISNPRTPKAERQSALEELDRIAPVAGSGSFSESGSSLEIREPKPTTSDNLALVARVEAARKTASVSLSSEMLLTAADIEAVRGMDLPAVSSAWYALIQSHWPETGFERIMQRGWLLNWRIATLKGTVTESFADYWKRCQERLNAESAFMERFKVASPTEQAQLVAEKYGLTK